MPHHLSALPSSSLPPEPESTPSPRTCLPSPQSSRPPSRNPSPCPHTCLPFPQSFRPPIRNPSPPAPNKATRHRPIPSFSSIPPRPGTELGACICALAHMHAPILLSPSPLKALRERGTKGERVPWGGGPQRTLLSSYLKIPSLIRLRAVLSSPATCCSPISS